MSGGRVLDDDQPDAWSPAARRGELSMHVYSRDNLAEIGLRMERDGLYRGVVTPDDSTSFECEFLTDEDLVTFVRETRPHGFELHAGIGEDLTALRGEIAKARGTYQH